MTDRAAWLNSPLGQRVYRLECKLIGEALTQVFGWQLLQIGLWGDVHSLLEGARTQCKTVVSSQLLPNISGVLSICSRLDALSIASDSVDAVLLPHTLECEANPHELLREVSRILPGDGQLILLGFRPFSSWGLRNLLAGSSFPPATERYLSEHRVRDWLQLLGFEVIEARRYLFTMPYGSAVPRAQRFLESTGSRLWPLFAGAYMLRARKRVYVLTPIRPRWRVPARAMGGLIETGTQMRSPDSKTGS
ncbi:MAG: class I SAM-dependent methyltransferase [Steroidobacteraceae bacterium]